MVIGTTTVAVRWYVKARCWVGGFSPSTTADSDSTLAYILDLDDGHVVRHPKNDTAGCMIVCDVITVFTLGQAPSCADF